MFTVLYDHAVEARLSAAGAVQAMREALLAAHRQRLTTPPRVHAGDLTFTTGRMAGRWYGYRSYDTHVGGQQLVVLHGEPSGEVVGLAVGSALGAFRTGALGGVAIDVLARQGARTVGVIGAGRQAWTQLWAGAAVRRITDVSVYSRTPDRRAAFAARLTADLGVAARAVDTPRAAVADRDIVILVTSSRTPVIEADWLSPGTAVTTLGPKQRGSAEFGLDLPARADLVATDSLAQLRAYDPPALLTDAPAVPLGAMLAGDHPGRTGEDQITLYASVGLAGTEPALLAHLLGV